MLRLKVMEIQCRKKQTNKQTNKPKMYLSSQLNREQVSSGTFLITFGNLFLISRTIYVLRRIGVDFSLTLLYKAVMW